LLLRLNFIWFGNQFLLRVDLRFCTAVRALSMLSSALTTVLIHLSQPDDLAHFKHLNPVRPPLDREGQVFPSRGLRLAGGGFQQLR